MGLQYFPFKATIILRRGRMMEGTQKKLKPYFRARSIEGGIHVLFRIMPYY